ncbi:Basic-leucine zipper transcription factor [Quillaja saponaria]|uniref:Basic-leucine zipper transcription factor n=1 Tax=Quillaja saponaria TaxID=32244 RepID=A0AAD7PC41_QUISA|nr:Basic-leucine zipper transcription factor [Quillaja saponaria]
MEKLNGSKSSGRQLPPPPKSIFQSIGTSGVEFISHPFVGSQAYPNHIEGQVRHQRTFSDSLLIEELPSWLEELLDEPETPVSRGHRRSSSDSVAYLEIAEKTRKEVDKSKITTSGLSQESCYFDHQADLSHTSYKMRTSFDNHQNKELDTMPSETTVKQNLDDREGSSVESDSLHANPSPSKADSKRAKVKPAQRSRARKHQYIAELERNIQVLMAKGSVVSAELEFLDQQNLILSMENRTLKQRLDTLSQEQLIKYMEHEMLEREILRLRYLYQQQQQNQQPKRHAHSRSKSLDLDSSFANLSLKNTEAGY